MAINVRQLTPADIPSLELLFGAYLDFYRVPRHVAAEREFLTGRLGADDTTCLGAFLGDELVGFALCHRSYNSLRLAPAWILHDLFVASAQRQRGVASALIRAVHEGAAKAGACEVVLSTAHDNTNAQALYEKLGYSLDTNFRVYVRDLRA